MPIQVISPGPLTTIQDLGRYGYSHLGITPAGAADQISFRIANLLVGNEENAPALEMTLIGAVLGFEEPAIVAVTGGECDCKLGSYAVPMNSTIEVSPGATLKCGTLRTGARAYLAVQGGFDVPLVMGSTSTHISGGFGGFNGRKLKSGDVLQLRLHGAGQRRAVTRSSLNALLGTTIRVTRGSQQEWFNQNAYDKLFSTTYSVTEHSDRTGLRLKGEAIGPHEHSQMITDGNPLGGIQVPEDGQPIVLFVDQQTTGGYPKIASVIMADMHRVGQLRPRDEVHFAEVTVPQAIELLRQQERLLREILVPLSSSIR